MGRSYVDQTSEYIFNIPATTAASTTYTKYIDVSSYQRGVVQVNWTAGFSGGTLAVKVYATTFEFKNEAAALIGDSGDIFQDISLTMFGGASLTGNSFILDDSGVLGCPTWLKFTATIVSHDAATALVSKINKCS